jgi:hypothetical protein
VRSLRRLVAPQLRRCASLVVLLLPQVALGDGPAELEVTAWVGAGGGSRLVGNELFTIGELSTGVEGTAQLTTFGRAQQYGGAYELRFGPWAGVSYASPDVLAEAGFKLHLSQLVHAPFGTYDLRVGAGAGSNESPWAPHIVVTAAGGVRSLRDRYRGSAGGTPTVLAFGSVLRVYLTTRIRQSSPSPWEITAGLELEPSFLAPPYSWQRLAGARY